MLEVPDEDWLRLDTGVAGGDDVPHYYDPLMAKLIVHGATRQEALQRLQQALDTARIEGINTTSPSSAESSKPPNSNKATTPLP